MNWLKALVGPLTEAFNRWRDRRHELKLKKHELKVVKIEGEVAIEQAKVQAEINKEQRRDEHSFQWEFMSIQNSGWKDEYITVLFTVPAVCIFIPYLQPHIEAGFKALEGTPLWYQMILFGIVGSALGIRLWDSFVKPIMMKKERDQ